MVKSVLATSFIVLLTAGSTLGEHGSKGKHAFMRVKRGAGTIHLIGDETVARWSGGSPPAPPAIVSSAQTPTESYTDVLDSINAGLGIPETARRAVTTPQNTATPIVNSAKFRKRALEEDFDKRAEVTPSSSNAAPTSLVSTGTGLWFSEGQTKSIWVTTATENGKCGVAKNTRTVCESHTQNGKATALASCVEAGQSSTCSSLATSTAVPKNVRVAAAKVDVDEAPSTTPSTSSEARITSAPTPRQTKGTGVWLSEGATKTVWITTASAAGKCGIAKNTRTVCATPLASCLPVEGKDYSTCGTPAPTQSSATVTKNAAKGQSATTTSIEDVTQILQAASPSLSISSTVKTSTSSTSAQASSSSSVKSESSISTTSSADAVASTDVTVGAKAVSPADQVTPQGWGAAFADRYTNANVANRGVRGASARSFYRDLWTNTLSQIKSGDVAVLEFGHYDSPIPGTLADSAAGCTGSVTGSGSNTVTVTSCDGSSEIVHTFTSYLTMMCNDVKAKGATCVISSITPKNEFKRNNQATFRSIYTVLAQQAASAAGVPYVSHTESSLKALNDIGPDLAPQYFNAGNTLQTNVAGADAFAASFAAAVSCAGIASLSSSLTPLALAQSNLC